MEKVKKSSLAVSRESDKFMLRFPEGMREKIAIAADQHGRSMNAEIVQRLQDSFDPVKRRGNYSLYGAVMAVLCQRLIEKLGQDGLGLTDAEFAQVTDVLSRRHLFGDDVDQAQINEVVEVAGLLGALPDITKTAPQDLPLVKKRAIDRKIRPVQSKKTP